VILDEPVSSLDVSIRAQILNLLRDLQREFGLTYLFISHDLAVVEFLCDRVGVMYLGKLVEAASADALFGYPHHPYTRALMSAVPGAGRVADSLPLVGEITSALDLPAGCRFHPRCPLAQARCRTEEPVLRDLGPGHLAACHYA
jgi:oligopeptide/dipeptide ABC transporter ATP-binding protein